MTFPYGLEMMPPEIQAEFRAAAEAAALAQHKLDVRQFLEAKRNRETLMQWAPMLCCCYRTTPAECTVHGPQGAMFLIEANKGALLPECEHTEEYYAS